MSQLNTCYTMSQLTTCYTMSQLTTCYMMSQLTTCYMMSQLTTCYTMSQLTTCYMMSKSTERAYWTRVVKAVTRGTFTALFPAETQHKGEDDGDGDDNHTDYANCNCIGGYA